MFNVQLHTDYTGLGLFHRIQVSPLLNSYSIHGTKVYAVKVRLGPSCATLILEGNRHLRNVKDDLSLRAGKD